VNKYITSEKNPLNDKPKGPINLNDAHQPEDAPCGGGPALFNWIETDAVKKALHVSVNASFFTGDNGIGFTYNQTEPNVIDFYNHVIANTSLRVLIYNGDTDPCINSFSANNWTQSLGFDVKEEWRGWTLDGKQAMGGYVTRYTNDFDYLTIRGSGHMVPGYRPRSALEFMTRWLNDSEYQQYVKPKNPPGTARSDL